MAVKRDIFIPLQLRHNEHYGVSNHQPHSTVYSSADQRNHQSSASLAFVRGIYRRPVTSPHKGPVTRKMFPFDDVSWTFQPSCVCSITFILTKIIVVVDTFAPGQCTKVDFRNIFALLLFRLLKKLQKRCGCWHFRAWSMYKSWLSEHLCSLIFPAAQETTKTFRLVLDYTGQRSKESWL